MKENLKTYTTSLPPDLIKKMKVHCSEKEIKVNTFIASAIREKLERKG